MRVQLTNFNTNYNYKNQNISFKAKPNIGRVCERAYDGLEVFRHHIYEYKKGVRTMVLTTERASNRAYIEKKLQSDNIPYLIHEVDKNKINVFFGNEDCIKVISTFDEHLNKLSPEKDFIVGILLGYDKIIQCKRYMKNIIQKKGLITG